MPRPLAAGIGILAPRNFYYIRKVLAQHAEELKSILSQKAGFCFNLQETLEQLLRDIYLEETLEELLQTLYADLPKFLSRCSS